MAFAEWTDTKGLTCLNPTDTLTWFHPTIPDRASIINLAFTNEALLLEGQVDSMAITDGPMPLTDHATLSLTYYPLMLLTFTPLPHPQVTLPTLNIARPGRRPSPLPSTYTRSLPMTHRRGGE